MKFTEVDMQDVQSQSSLKVQSSDNGTPDRGNRRTRPLDSINKNNSAKATPEVINLDEEDSPKPNEEVPLPINGVTTVRKVSLPWPRNINLNTVDKKSSESSVESTSAEYPTSERGSIPSNKLSDPVEADEALSNQSIEGERKRPNITGNEENDSKRPKIDSCAKVPCAKASPKENESSPKPSTRDSPEVSVVDLVEDDDEPEKVSDGKKQETSATNDGTAKVDNQTSSDSKPSVMAPSKSKSPVPLVEKKTPPSAAPATTAQGPVSVQSPNLVTITSVSVPAEEKRSSLSSMISSGKNGLISQMPSIEVKKVKLSPELEKQATAMSVMTMSPAVASPKPATSTSLAQIPGLTTYSSENSEISSSAPSKSSESAKEAAGEGETVLMGAELEKKKGLNPIHSETRKAVKRLTRSELESFFLELACEVVLSKSEVGKFRQLYEEMKETCEIKSNKIAQLNKQLVDLSAVVHRTINDLKEKKTATPLKITRSVGLQLEQSQIFAAMKNRAREERGLVAPSPSLNSHSNSSQLTSDRLLSAKYGRSSNFSRTTPSTPNGLISGAGMKDVPPGASVPAKSPQRQLKALHPRPSTSAPQSLVQSPSMISSPASMQPTQSTDSTSKRLGFIDIADDKIVNSGTPIGIKRHRSPMMAGASSSSVNSTTVLSSISPNQAIAPTLKVVPSPYSHTATIPGANYSQSGTNTRVVTATTIPVASGTPISSSRLAYLIPPSSQIAVQQQRVVFTSAAQSQQIRGRGPVPTMAAAMIVRPNTALVQVPPGSVTTSAPSLMRALQPNTAQQVMNPARSPPQQQPARLLGVANRPSPATPKLRPVQHPAPLPAQPQPTVVNSNLKPIPRRPVLKLSKVLNGIVLSWNMTTTTPHEEIASYQLYAYQEGANAPPSPTLWKKVGDVKALPLPMACTLTQFADGHTYHFAVRAVDVHGRVGEFSVPGTIELFG
ncbi:activating transcription factor 7-interacting protein 1-like isoform X1 [Hetaerina americana]|uniref:activating transcription factor 7-interacting protein 1-like isoform X1 n=1 Tax=Hetaerina americana TaxID=62018 RepID=UPI003A7F5F60